MSIPLWDLDFLALSVVVYHGIISVLYISARKGGFTDMGNSTVALANAATYDSMRSKEYIDGAPHIKHAYLRMFYTELIEQVYDHARKYTRNTSPRVLDLGSGEGSTTLHFLKLGAMVTAVDISGTQLSALQNKCRCFDERLEVHHTDIEKFMESETGSYDVIVASSFLHHIPDYLGLIRKVTAHIAPYGQFFSFQDPLRYDSMGKLPYLFSTFAYFSWRMFQGDLLNGAQRRLRRARGIYLADCDKDNTEYHVTRNGVDQNAIASLLDESGFRCRTITYFSTQSSVFQSIGVFMGIKNTFAVIAGKKS